MASKKQRTYSLGQMSLEDLPEFWGDKTDLSSKVSEQKRQLSCSERIDVRYGVDLKMSRPDRQKSPETKDNQMRVYVGITFDVCQGIREVKQQWAKNSIPSTVVFDCSPLELAPKYATEPTLNELLEPEYHYLIGRGGLLSNVVFINLLRCHVTLAKWSQDEEKSTGIKPIINFDFIPSSPSDPVGKLWNVLGMPELIKLNPKNAWASSSDKLEFQSRFVTPLLMVNSDNRNDILVNSQKWLDFILKRIGDTTYSKLWKLVIEVVKNLVDHGNQGIFGVSVWPSGQIEIIWSNPIEHLAPWWPPDDTAKGLAESLLNSSGGGMTYIYEDLLVRYKGVLIINWKTYNLIFGSAKDFSITGLNPRIKSFQNKRIFFPQSILFHLHLFCQDTRNRSER